MTKNSVDTAAHPAHLGGTVGTSEPRTASSNFRDKVGRRIARQSFATLSTSSPIGRPHVAGVLYEAVDSTLWVHTLRTSRKARNISSSGFVAVCVPFRILPVGPPYTIQFQTEAELVDMDAPEVAELLSKGQLKSISGHGALDMVDGCFIKIHAPRVAHTFGVGVRLIDLIRDPINSGARTVRFDDRYSGIDE